MAEPQPRRSMRSLDAMGRLLADGVALRNRCPQGQADPRAAIAGGASGVTMARAGPHPRRARSMRWADVYVPHVSPASMSPASMAMGRRLRLHAGRRCCPRELDPPQRLQSFDHRRETPRLRLLERLR